MSEYVPVAGDVREAKLLQDDGINAQIDLILNGSWVGQVVIDVSSADWAMKQWIVNGRIHGYGYTLF